MGRRIAIGLLCCLLLLNGCGKKNKAETSPVVTEQETQYNDQKERNDQKEQKDQEPEEVQEPQAINPLSGLPMEKEFLERRPMAVMINNLPKALPQSGISQAEIVYEVLAEGGITRLEAIFLEADANKIGPIRSAREYYVTIAQEYDAVFVHHGGSPTGYQAIRERKVDHIDGMVDTAFWRDAERLKRAGMYEHSSYSNVENLRKNWQEKGYRKESAQMSSPGFLFCDKDTPLLDGSEAKHLVLPYSFYQESEFIYQENSKLYERYENGKPQIDELTGEVLTTKNIIIQCTDCYVTPGDDAGRLTVKLMGEGNGFYLTNGKVIPIIWHKEGLNSKTEWSYEAGGTLQLNPGNTWICVFPLNRPVIIEGVEQ